MNDRVPPLSLAPNLVALRDRALAEDSLNGLTFVMANDLYPLLRFRQAVVAGYSGQKLSTLCISGLAKPAEDSPYLLWLQSALAWIHTRLNGTLEPIWLARTDAHLPPHLAEGWQEWWPTGAWCVPLAKTGQPALGVLVFLLDAPPDERLQAALNGVWATWAYCWSALQKRRTTRFWQPSRRHAALAVCGAAALLCVPIRQTALAPAEVVSLDAQIISAPIDGVIATMQVRPNEAVVLGTPLFRLDDTTLRSRADVLAKEVAVADAELGTTSQRAFDHSQSMGELSLLKGRALQRRAELAAVEAQLKRTAVLAPRPGVAIYSDPNDWLGKPVVTGERIMHLADPAKPAMRIQLAVNDAITLAPGAEVKLFLSAFPLSPLTGHITETSYQAKVTDDGIAAYRLMATIDGPTENARLGLHGTAKLYGERVLLGYYLFRRPLSALRAWSGL